MELTILARVPQMMLDRAAKAGLDRAGLDRAAGLAESDLANLYSSNPKAKELGSNAEGILVFPDIKKGGLVVAGAWGDGALYQRGKATGYYRSIAASYGLQAGLGMQGTKITRLAIQP